MLNFLEEIKQDKKKVIGLLVVFGIIAVLDFMYVIKIQAKSCADLGKQVTKFKKDIEGVNKELAVLKKLKPQNEEKPRRLLKIYSEQDIPLLLQDISLKAQENNVRVTKITPSKEVKAKDKKSKSKEPEISQGVAVKLEMNCGYHNLGDFINSLENSGYPVFADNIRINRDPDNDLKQDVILILKTYVKK